jgi:hypothetical protein
VKPGFEKKIPRTAEQFSEIYQKSDLRRRNQNEIAEFEADTKRLIEERQQAETEATKTKNYSISFGKQVLACANRQFKVVWGDKFAFWGKWGVSLDLLSSRDVVYSSNSRVSYSRQSLLEACSTTCPRPVLACSQEAECSSSCSCSMRFLHSPS